MNLIKSKLERVLRFSVKEIAGGAVPLVVAEKVTLLEGVSSLFDGGWALINYADQEPIEGHQPTLKLESGQVSGTTGCNHYEGTYQIEEDRIQFDGVYSTEMACLEPEGLMEQDVLYLEILSEVTTFQMDPTIGFDG